MVSNIKDLKHILEKYCYFYDSVLTEFLICFDENSKRKITIRFRCRCEDNSYVHIEICFGLVFAWSFQCNEKEVAEVVTEGFRFKQKDDKWFVDFGDDPDIDMEEPDWFQYSRKWIVGRELAISEIDVDKIG